MHRAGLRPVHLKPGEYFCSDEPALVTTVLGSCVAVTFYCARFPLAAICHVVMPACRNEGKCLISGLSSWTPVAECEEPYKFTTCAILMLYEKFRVRGIMPSEIEVKVFGGSNVLARDDTAHRALSIGRQNIDRTLSVLEKIQIKLLSYHVGGAFGRKILFNTATGEVLLKHLREVETLGEEEIKRLKHKRHRRMEGL